MKSWLLFAFILSFSTVACGTTTEPVPEPAPAKPSPVQIKDVDANEGTITIAFIPQTVSPSIQYRVTCLSTGGQYTATGSSSPITVTGLTNGTRYTCTVIAFDSNFSSDQSTAVLATPGVPFYKPSLLYLLTPGYASASAVYGIPLEFLRFNDPRPWFVALTCKGGGSSLTATVIDSVVGFVTVVGMQNGLTYSCTLRVTTASAVAIGGPVDVVPGTPVRPFGPGATPGNASATISFQPSTDNGSPVTGYTVTCEAAGKPSRTVNGPSSPLVVTGLANATEYSCVVYASNSVGPGEKSASATVIPGIPGPVRSLTATTTTNSTTLSFSPPETDNGSPITRYTVWCSWSVNGPNPPPWPTASGPASPITVTGLSVNMFYNCSVFATNANGSGPSVSIGVTTKP